MEQWWSENWQFAVGTGIAVLGILISIAIVVWQRQPKRLDYEIITNVPILSTDAGLSSKLEIEYTGVKVGKPHLVSIRITNTGKRAIESEDYETPIWIEYERNHPFDGFVTNASSRGVSADIDMPKKGPEVAVTPGLLNPKEWFDVQLISDGDPGEIKASSRFANQSRQMRKFHRRSSSFVALYIVISFIGGATIGSLTIRPVPPEPGPWLTATVAEVTWFPLIVALLVTIVLARMAQRYVDRGDL